MAQLRPYFAALHRIAATGFDADWVVYLSAQDYPTQPLAALATRLASSGADGFLTWWEAFGRDNPWGRRRQGLYRYAYRYAPAPRWLAPHLGALRFVNRLQRAIHIQTTYGPLVGRRARRTPFSERRVCYAGSQWTILARPCIEFLAEALHRERELLAHYERCLVPDESVVQTLLVNSGRFRLINDSLRYQEVGGNRDGSARVLTAADLPALADPRYFFARKFAVETDESVLDRLDERIFAPETSSSQRPLPSNAAPPENGAAAAGFVAAVEKE
jgi:hypothetical protein